ncbi:hypothetical protein Tco_0233551, partial [Tanacetum coccineum]
MFFQDSLLLGKLNMSLLKLLTGVEKELDIEYVSHISKNWKYYALIQSRRLQRDIKKTVDARVHASNMRHRSELKAQPVEINVVSRPIQRYVV